ncbi:hypothetical protein I601_2160 [Nocardioides dokdonensis FR1436]|uniref:ARB-07466-like C-terminal domain-containing protein n=1 Tax=Nocardioides dokdonensis FR1436 TaxID=1300347 RepID=A0A1A9GMA8_9ACTN|nr:hypothetical protein [Nocardioides dokdonensis]ANH38585.1 hypothetical protein I601_2160 [Nocardioides dokdonensis FR1436]
MRKLVPAVVITLVVAGVIGVGVWALVDRVGGLFTSRTCTATVAGSSVDLTPEQAENAGLIAAIGVRRGLPARAVSIALATAYQESKIVNLTSGDRDSLGLFQQRPSQGWGSEEQVLDPVYSTNAFYDALVEIDGYREMEVTEAAQAVQRSGFPEAYADHEADARVLASALTGNSPAALSCEVPGDAEAANAELRDVGLTFRADKVRKELTAVFGDLSVGGFAPGGVSTGHQEGSAHYEGRAVDVFFRPVSEQSAVRGWAMAHYLVTQAERMSVATIIFDDKIWTARRSAQGWRDYDVDTSDVSAETAEILEHRDHVHVDVFS